MRWPTLVLFTAVLIAGSSGCSETIQGGAQGANLSDPGAKYSTTSEMASAVRNRQMKDGSVAFSFTTLGSDGEGFTGRGTFATRRDGTDSQETLKTVGPTTSSLELILLGSNAYIKRGPSGGERGQSWTKQALGEVVTPSSVGTLGILTKALGRYDLTAPAEIGATSVPVEVALVLDSVARLQKASWAIAANGKTTTTEYYFSDWGACNYHFPDSTLIWRTGNNVSVQMVVGPRPNDCPDGLIRGELRCSESIVGLPRLVAPRTRKARRTTALDRTR